MWRCCAVREAARLCRSVRTEISPDVLAKKDKSPVTVADFGSQALICRALAEAFPDDPIIAEEDAAELRQAGNAAILDQVLRHVRPVRAERGDALDADEVCRWIDRGGTSRYRDRFWTLDPIDGTKGFLRGEQYAVALALVVDGQVAVAALACPAWWRVAGGGWRVKGIKPGPTRGRSSSPCGPGGVRRGRRDPGSMRPMFRSGSASGRIRRPCGSASRSSRGIALMGIRRPSPAVWG